MNPKKMLDAATPYGVGGILGAALITAVGFSADWVVSRETMTTKIVDAKISVLAEVCDQQAERYWREQGKLLADLKGWDNQDREDLAKRFTPDLARDDGFRDDVAARCEDLLRPA